LDISNPVNPTPIWEFHEPRSIGRAYIRDTLLFVPGGQWDGFWVINVSDIDTPQIISHYPTTGSIRGIGFFQNYAYVADSDTGILIVNISNPSNPQCEGFYPAQPNTNIFIQSHYAYVTQPIQHEAMAILDLSQPANPVLVGMADAYGLEYGVFVQGGYAYITTYDTRGYRGLTVIDVSQPANPVVMGSCEIGVSTRELFVSGGYAYAVCFGQGLKIIDVSDPMSPTLVRTYDTGARTSGIAIVGNTAFVTDDTNGVLALNITDPANPLLEASFDTPGLAYGVCVDSNSVFVADYRSLLIFRYQYPDGLEEGPQIPLALSLFPAYPNPFNAATTIAYSLPAEAEVLFEAYDIAGRRVESRALGRRPAGNHAFVWEAAGLSSGVYLYRLRAGAETRAGRCILLK
jgi:hypothetical protein